MKRLVLLVTVVIALAGCGTGGGGGVAADTPSNPPPVAVPLAKYVGTWVESCDSHSRITTVLAPSPDGATLTLDVKDEFFANADCSGAIVAIGTYEKPRSVITYDETVANAAVRMKSGGTVLGAVDKVTSTMSGASIKYTGSGVTSSTVIGNKTYSRIVYNNGYTDIESDNASGGGQFGLFLQNGELFILNPVSNYVNMFDVEARYTH